MGYKAQLMSDLHTCFYYGDSGGMLKKLLFAPNLDFLFLPGDIIVPAHQSSSEMKGIFEFLASKARHVIYTFGNHEFYSSKKGVEVENRIRDIIPDNVHILENSEITIDGVEFYGGTLWFPYDPLNQIYEKQLNDFRLIGDFHDWVYKKNEEFRMNGQRIIRPETVVLSHHIPSSVCIAEQYKEDNFNRFFVSDETYLILDKKPRLWVFGHTHSPWDCMLGCTRLVCNPYGYPTERGKTPYPPVIFDI